jgi:PAS domain S-box-containing protein
MNSRWEQSIQYLSRHLVWAGVVFSILYWFIESLMHCFLFEKGSFLMHFLQPSMHEIWMRMIVALLLVTFSIYGQAVINQRKRAEKAVTEREKEATLILENNPAAIILIDIETRKIAYANTNAQKMVRAPLHKIIGNACHKFLCPAQKGACPVLDLGQNIDISERPLLRYNGEEIPVLKSVTKVRYQGREHLLEAFFDITRQHKMELAIRQAHQEMDQIFQTASVGMRVIDHEFNILKVNHAFSKLTGIGANAAVGRKCYDVFAGSMCHTPDCPLKTIFGGKGQAEHEVSKKRSDGSPLNCILTATRFENTDGEFAGIVESFKDVTELKKTQMFLESERDKLHRILFHQFESVGIVSADFKIEYQNELLKRKTGGGLGCLCYKVFRNMDEPCDECLMHKALETGKIQRFDFDTNAGKSYQHTYTPFVDTDGQKKAVVSQRDITERKRSQAAANRSEHLAAIGELAAGVAHEINNPINGIVNYAQMMVNKTDQDNDLNKISLQVIKEGARIAGIVKTLLSFARRDRQRVDFVQVGDLIQDSLTITQAQLRKDGIKLSIRLDEKLMPIPVKAQEIQQVFVNIINNSRYALNEKYRDDNRFKRLEISTRLTGNNGYSTLQTCFTDWGTGIKPELLEKITRPFFSTKPKGKGTGLGLSISQKIIEDHGGQLMIESAAGSYTKVTVAFPVSSTNG